MNRMPLVAFLALLGVALPAQGFDAVLSGNMAGGCHVLSFRRPALEWVNPNGTELETDILAVASGDGRRVLATLGHDPYRIVAIQPEGVQTHFATGGAGVAAHLAVADDGRVYALATTTGSVRRIDRFSPAGTLEASYPLGVIGASVGGLDVASDNCTLFYGAGTTIERFNGCTGTPLPSFATVPDLRDIEVQPGGTVLVATESAVLLYTAAGALSRTVATLSAYGFDPTKHLIDQAAVRDGVVWFTANNPCAEGNLLRVTLENGAELSRRELGVINDARALVLGGNVNVPLAGETALALLVFALGAAGAFVLRLR